MVLSTLLSKIISKFESQNIYVSHFSAEDNFIKLSTLRSSMSLLLRFKLPFQHNRASRIVEHIMQVNSSDFWYTYFICNMAMKDSRKHYQYTQFRHNQLIPESTSENVTIVHVVVRARQTIDFNSHQTMRNSADVCCDFGNSYYKGNTRTRSRDRLTNTRFSNNDN